MSVLNVMWSSGAAFTSVHGVHRSILDAACPGERVINWMLREGGGDELNVDDGSETLGISSRTAKGRGFGKVSRFFLLARLARKLTCINPRVAVLDGIGVARLLLPLLTKKAIPCVIIFHGNSSLKPRDRKLLKKCKTNEVRIVAVSETLAKSLELQLQQPVSTVVTAVDYEIFGRHLLSRESARAALAITACEAPVLGAVGRLVCDKNFGLILEALSLVPPASQRPHLVIVGEGPDRKSLEHKVKVHGLESQVTFSGHRPDIRTLYKAFDVVLVPSRQEGLGLVVQEAVMASVPVLCSDLAVFREQLGAAGVYLPTDSPGDWCSAIESFVGDRAQQLASDQYRYFNPPEKWAQFQLGYRSFLAEARSSSQ